VVLRSLNGAILPGLGALMLMVSYPLVSSDFSGIRSSGKGTPWMKGCDGNLEPVCLDGWGGSGILEGGDGGTSNG